MQSISALSLAPGGNDWLASSHHPRILHVFDDACNLINEHGKVLSVVTQKVGNGPFNLVVKENVLFSDHLSADSKISIQSNQLTLEHLNIKIDKAELWSPRPNWEVLHEKRNNILNQVISLQKWNSFIKQEIVSSQNALLATLAPAASAGVTSSTNYHLLISTITSADLTKGIASAKQLAGLGQGLTPSGDDFILGAVLAAWIIHPSNVAGVLAEEITKAAAPLTTSLSAAWLRSTGRGEAGILWHNFFNALIADDPMTLQLQITKLLSIGHTSGADAFAGFMDTFIGYAESEEKSCPS